MVVKKTKIVKKSKPANSDNKQTVSKDRKVNWLVCLLMSIFFGVIGVDRFMMGKVGTGLLKLFTLGGFGVWWLIDVILIATKYKFDGVNWVE